MLRFLPLLAGITLLVSAPAYSGPLDWCSGLMRRLGFSSPQDRFANLPPSTPEAIALVNSTLDRLWKDYKPVSDLTCSDGGCVPRTNLLQRVLQSKGVPTRRIRCENRRRLLISGARRPNYAFHEFLTLPAGPNRDEIIIDSTYRQFFRPEARESLPDTFVGTRSDLIHFFASHQKDIARVRAKSPNESIDARDFVEVTYGLSRGWAARKTIKPIWKP